jgi:two-component system CheB/CheR fusion protein
MSDDLTLQQLVDELATEKGPDLRGYKHTSLQRRVRKRMAEVGVPTFHEYLQKVREDPIEPVNLLRTILINVTEFFRDPQAWQALRDEGLHSVLGWMQPGDTLRIWSVGCATGEEPYSLAILISEYLGAAIMDYNIKIYATDIDEDALNIARRGEYAIEKLRRMAPQLREKYFTGRGALLRISRDIRRLTIFGRSNIVSDAPISHCNLVVCRNVLIYFDSNTQNQVLSRIHYALEPGGVLFLGKAESKLANSSVFLPLNTRWRIFQKHPLTTGDNGNDSDARLAPPMRGGTDLVQHEMESLQLYQRSILETVKSGLLALDGDDIVLNHNDMFAQIWNLKGNKLIGKRLQNTELTYRCPELISRLEANHAEKNQLTQFQCTTKTDGEDRLVNVAIRPVMATAEDRIGTIIYSEDITDRERLQGTVEQLEATSEELQSANEELETTNEELQSTNEELETTNEELQSTNEELATTNEELQSLNEELENMNEELEHRTQELHQLNQRYAETLKSMPWPVALVDDNEKIQLWNAAAQRLFGVGETSVVGVGIDHLPVQLEVRNALIRRYRAVLLRGKAGILRTQSLEGSHYLGEFDVHFTPVFNNSRQVEGVLMMFGPGSDPEGATVKPGIKKTLASKSTARSDSRTGSATKSKPRGNSGKR